MEWNTPCQDQASSKELAVAISQEIIPRKVKARRGRSCSALVLKRQSDGESDRGSVLTEMSHLMDGDGGWNL